MVAIVRAADPDLRRRRAQRIRLFLIMARAGKPSSSDDEEDGGDDGGGGVPANALLAEDGTPILAEDGSYILV